MIVDAIQFVRPIPVFGTGRREEHFEKKSGWRIEVAPDGVTLSRKAEAAQNIPAVPAYRVVGVGFCVPIADVGTISEATLANQDIAAERLLGAQAGLAAMGVLNQAQASSNAQATQRGRRQR